jgi:hypothetical protein
MIPLLVMLAAKQDVKTSVLLSFFAIVPDFDSLLGPHRMVLHNVFVAVLIPLVFIVIARYKKPEFVVPGLIILFYMSSHLLLDLQGVALFYPLDSNAYKFVPVFEFFTAPTVHFNFYIDWGVAPLEQVTEYNLFSPLITAYFLFIGILSVTYRSEIKVCVRKSKATVKSFIRRIGGSSEGKGSP